MEEEEDEEGEGEDENDGRTGKAENRVFKSFQQDEKENTPGANVFQKGAPALPATVKVKYQGKKSFENLQQLQEMKAWSSSGGDPEEEELIGG